MNEAAVRMFNLENPLEQTIDKGTLGKKNVDVIGIAKDFHFKSFHYSIEPLVIYHLDVENDPQHRATFTLVKIIRPICLQHYNTFKIPGKNMRNPIPLNTLSSTRISIVYLNEKMS